MRGFQEQGGRKAGPLESSKSRKGGPSSTLGEVKGRGETETLEQVALDWNTWQGWVSITGIISLTQIFLAPAVPAKRQNSWGKRFSWADTGSMEMSIDPMAIWRASGELCNFQIIWQFCMNTCKDRESQKSKSIASLEANNAGSGLNWFTGQTEMNCFY